MNRSIQISEDGIDIAGRTFHNLDDLFGYRKRKLPAIDSGLKRVFAMELQKLQFVADNSGLTEKQKIMFKKLIAQRYLAVANN